MLAKLGRSYTALDTPNTLLFAAAVAVGITLVAVGVPQSTFSWTLAAMVAGITLSGST